MTICPSKNLFYFFLGVFLSSLFSTSAHAQCTAGNVTKAHSSSIYNALLDPDGDGYITESGSSFSSDTTEMAEFEVLANSTSGWVKLIDVSETGKDITPNCGNPDLTTDKNGSDFAYYNIVDPTPGSPSNGDEHMIIRFRLADAPNGNFGYNFLIDIDTAYGIVADPNDLCGNRGFEREIQFANKGGKKGVSVYDIDGSTSFNSTLCNQCISVNDVQEACAASAGACTSASDPTFITFPVPLSYIGISSDISESDLYISAATANSGNGTSVLGGGNVTDIGAIDGDTTGCATCDGLTGCALFDCQTECLYNALISLPVELLFFEASPEGESVLLTWATATEINNSHFAVEASEDGYNFYTLDLVKGAGNSIETLKYSYLHRNPSSEKIYYRLRQVDFDGSFEFSSIKVVALGKTKDFDIFPTLAKERVRINFQGLERHEIQLTVFDAVGRKIEVISLGRDHYSFELKINSYPIGHYFVQLQYDRTVLVKRFIKT